MAYLGYRCLARFTDSNRLSSRSHRRYGFVFVFNELRAYEILGEGGVTIITRLSLQATVLPLPLLI